MKRIITMLLVIALLIGTLPVVTASAEDYATVYSGNQYGVRLREGPGTGYSQIVYVPSGTSAILLETGAIWSKIQVGTTVGYMMSKFLVAGGTSSGVTIQSDATVYSGNGLRVWLRTSPNGKRIGLYSPGTPVGIIEYGDEWCKVMIGSSIGYMMTTFLTVTPKPTPTPVPVAGKMTSMTINYPYPIVGDVLKPVTVPSDATVTCQWEVCPVNADGSLGTPIYTSTAPALTVLSSYLNCMIKLTVNGTGTSTGVTFSDTSAQVANTKAITGVLINNEEHIKPVVGDVLSAVIAPSSATVTYSWRVGGNQVSTAASYTVLSSDAGKTIQVYVEGTGNYTGKANSLLTEAVAKANEIVEVKLNTEYPVVGGTVSAVVRPAGANVTYAWTSGGVAVGTGASYTCTAADLGKQLQVTVKGAGTYTGSAASGMSDYVAQTLLTGVTLDNATPAEGETIKATVTPAGANATFEWYSYDASGSTVKLATGDSNTFTVPSGILNKSIYVVACGEGIYGGKVTSARTSVVTDFTTLTGISITQASPVVGDTITAKLTPSTAKADDGNVYLWYAGTGLAAITTDPKYTVADEDWNYPLYVQVNGGGTNTGSVRSAYTNKVTDSKALGGVSIQYKDLNSSSYAWLGGEPLINQTLKAIISPEEAAEQVNYVWTVSGSTVPVGQMQTLTVQEAWKGKTITVTVTGKDPKKYTGSLSKTTAAVPNTANNLAIELEKRITPEAGRMPVTYIEGDKIGTTNNRTYTASITWVEPLDIDGTFLAGQNYTAKIDVRPYGGYSLVGLTAKNKDNSDAAVEVSGNSAICNFAAIDSKTINLFNVTGLNMPAVGSAPDTAITGNKQFTGKSVVWYEGDPNAGGTQMAGNFKAGVTYFAKITVQKVAPYLLPTKEDGYPTITVLGARSVRYEYGDTDEGAIVASFNTTSADTKASLTASRVTVPVGSSDKKVQVSAYLSNYSGNQDAIDWNWTVNGQTKDETTIDQNGTLNISMDEPAPNTLTVTAQVKIDNVDYRASISIALTAEAAGDIVAENVAVQFIKAPSTATVTPGTTATVNYVAMALNANDEDVTWKVANKTDSATSIANGVLTIGANETAGSLAITATAIANRQKSATVYLTLNYTESQPLPPEVTFTQKWATMTPGSAKDFKAVCNYESTSASITKDTKYIVSKGASVSVSGGVATVTIDATTQPDDIIALSAVVTVMDGAKRIGEYTETTTIKIIAPSTPMTLAEATDIRTAAQKAYDAGRDALSKANTTGKTVDQLNAEVSAANTELVGKQEELAKKNKELVAAQAAMAAQTALTDDLNAAQKALKEAQEALADAKTKQSNAETAASNAESAKKKADEQKAAADTAVTNADAALQLVVTEEGNAKAALASATKALSDAKDLVASRTTERDSAKAAWDAVKDDPNVDAAVKAEKQSAYQIAEDNLKKANDAVAAANIAIQNANAAVKDAGTKVANATSVLATAQVNQHNVNEAAVAAGDAKTKADEAVDTAKGAVTTAEGNVKTAKDKVQSAEDALGGLMTAVKTAEGEVKTAQDNVAAQQLLVDQKTAMVNEIVAAVKEATNDMNRAEAAYTAADKLVVSLGGATKPLVKE